MSGVDSTTFTIINLKQRKVPLKYQPFTQQGSFQGFKDAAHYWPINNGNEKVKQPVRKISLLGE